MRMTNRKKEILSYFEPDNLEWVTGEIGAPPFDVSGVAYLLHGMVSFDKRHQIESTRRTLESMVAGGLLERVLPVSGAPARAAGAQTPFAPASVQPSNLQDTKSLYMLMPPPHERG